MENEPHQRVCFLLKVKPHMLAEYRRRHQAVWPELRDTLSKAGWHNYSLFLRDDGLLIGYVETPDFRDTIRQLAQSDVNRRWQAEMADFFDGAPGCSADEQMVPVPEVFHLP
jgi:L-rhamnose mutarotase